MNRPELGVSIVSANRLKRVKTSEGNGGYIAEWKQIPTYTSGIYIGYRTLSEGKVWWHYDEGYEYEATKFFEAWLIVVDDRTNPIYVLPEECIWEMT